MPFKITTPLSRLSLSMLTRRIDAVSKIKDGWKAFISQSSGGLEYDPFKATSLDPIQ
ncbi:hypothetical protein [Shewanella phaeophyticola]|uniref:Uncharacterized protein n=1 Tax=Shewanella phaeophyticola TaxID=2978345 RepID=A0ABT2P6V0_9GAMM|nr:hypothetical protein [Shewanella sp. KJ10-1]MCT8987380.1 hypothetical protein [Shewanella sp. KJ10-1]